MSDTQKFDRFYRSGFGKRVLKTEADYVRRQLEGCGRILDVGCGIGTFEQELSDMNITGLDISEEMISEARRRCGSVFVLGNAEELVFGDSSFDAVFFVATLEFVADYKKAVREAWRVTRPGGRLLVMMLNPESQYFREQSEDEGSYFRKVLHADVKGIRDYISELYHVVNEEYILGISEQEIFDTSDEKYASLYAVTGEKK